jgi:hypothetical protein
MSVASSAVSLQHQYLRIRIPTRTDLLTPTANRRNSKPSGNFADSDYDQRVIGSSIVHPVRRGSVLRVAAKIVRIDELRFATVGLSRILEIADQLRLLGIDTHCRLASAMKPTSNRLNVSVLFVPVWMRIADEPLDVTPQ